MGDMKKSRLAFLFIALLPLGATATEMCAPNENPYVCTVIEERNNALNELAQAEGGRRMVIAKQAAEQAWWKGYVEGIDEQAAAAKSERERLAEFWASYVAALPEGGALSAHIERICTWKGTFNEPTAQLCAWWRAGLK
jgi:hypothetical protein